MLKPIRLTLFWTPRVAGILFVLFLSIFALDVFGETRGFWETLLALPAVYQYVSTILAQAKELQSIQTL